MGVSSGRRWISPKPLCLVLGHLFVELVHERYFRVPHRHRCRIDRILIVYAGLCEVGLKTPPATHCLMPSLIVLTRRCLSTLILFVGNYVVCLGVRWLYF